MGVLRQQFAADRVRWHPDGGVPTAPALIVELKFGPEFAEEADFVTN
jgi:hypothetical protein